MATALRAEATAFVPEAIRREADERAEVRGNQLIQQLADVIAQQVPRVSGTGSQRAEQLAELPAAMPAYPADGLFCPSCSQGLTCVFHCAPPRQCRPLRPCAESARPRVPSVPTKLPPAPPKLLARPPHLPAGVMMCPSRRANADSAINGLMIAPPPGLEENAVGSAYPDMAALAAKDLEDNWTDVSTSESLWTEVSDLSECSQSLGSSRNSGYKRASCKSMQPSWARTKVSAPWTQRTAAR